MDKKKKIFIALIVVWVIVYILVHFTNNKTNVVNETKNFERTSKQKVTQKNIAEKKEYPPLKLAITRKDLFNELYRPDLEAKKKEIEKKKTMAIPAPPLPLLPEEPKKKQTEKEEDVDTLKEITLMGIFNKEGKDIAFFKKNRDIKTVREGEKVFDSTFVVERIDKSSVTLKDEKGKIRTITVEKEVKDVKK